MNEAELVFLSLLSSPSTWSTKLGARSGGTVPGDICIPVDLSDSRLFLCMPIFNVYLAVGRHPVPSLLAFPSPLDIRKPASSLRTYLCCLLFFIRNSNMDFLY